MVKLTIDDVDRRILRVLAQEGRISIARLAERVELSATPCKRRLSLLEESGVIAGYGVQLDRRASGFGITAFTSVEMERQDSAELADFQRAVARFEEVVTGTLMTGSQDFLLEICVESLEEYEKFLQTKLLRLNGVRAVRSRFALRKFVDRSRIP